MKTIRTISIIAVFAALTSMVAAQDYPDEYLGLPGDNLNLYAVMNLFQESETLEAFERSLNDQESTINNLDLNGDNFVDYITVSDYVDNNVHTIVLRAFLNQNEQQDIAVFVVEKLKNDAVQIQLIGDEALYGPDYIVEPIYAETPNPGYSGNANRNATVYNSTYYEIAAWPVVRFIYHPRYTVWRSSWYWGYYPSYWHAWTPHYWHYYYGYHSHWHNHYYSHYRHWNNYRCRAYNTFYRSRVRVYSPTVLVNINRGHYRKTYSQPNQRRAGEQHYAQSARQRSSTSRNSVSAQRNSSRTGTVSQRQSTQRNSSRTGTVSQRQSTERTRTTSSGTSSRVSTRQRNPNTVRSSATRSSSQRSTPAVSRSSTQRSTPAVSRNKSQARSSSSVSRSSTQRSAPAVSRSSSQRSKASVQKSSSQRKSSSSVSRSSSKRSTPPASRSSSRNSGKKSGGKSTSRR